MTSVNLERKDAAGNYKLVRPIKFSIDRIADGWSASDKVFPLTEDLLFELASNQLVITAYTVNNKAGEMRGQVIF